MTTDDDEPYIDPTPPSPPPELPKPPEDAAEELAKLINQIDNDAEGSRAVAANLIYRLLRRRKENFIESYEVKPRGIRAIWSALDYYLSISKQLVYHNKNNEYLHTESLRLHKQNERMRQTIELLRQHVSDNTYRKIRDEITGRYGKDERPFDLPIVRRWGLPSLDTFTIPPVRDLLQRHIRSADAVVDPFARNSKWGTVTNDLNPLTTAQFHMDAIAFLRTLRGQLFDGALIDPPYSVRKVRELYEGYGTETTSTRYKVRLHDEIAPLIKLGGYAITCGWNSGGIGIKRGFDLCEVLLVMHGSPRNDTIVTVERKTSEPQDWDRGRGGWQYTPREKGR